MINRWKELGEIPCVKSFGMGHNIAHFIGIKRSALCFSAYFDEGLRRGFKGEDD